MRIKLLTNSLCIAIASLAGCSTVDFRQTNQPRGNRADQELADRFIQKWNANAEELKSVVCQHVDVTGTSEGQPYTLDAQLAFQEPKDFRLVGKVFGKQEADLGSNGKEVWFWMARSSPPAVYFCKREDLPRVNLPLPFHPDDLVQVLGVAPLDEERFRFELGTPQFVTMVAAENAPNGQPVVKRLVIDRATNRAAAFQIWDQYGQSARLLAEAHILDYHEDPSGVFVPRKVQLRLPQAKTNLKLSMRTRSIEVNAIDPQWASTLFHRGDYADTQVVDLGEELRRRQAAVMGPDLADMSRMQNQAPPVTPSDAQPQEIASSPAPGGSGATIERALVQPFEGVAPGQYRGAITRPASTGGASLTGRIEQTGASVPQPSQ